VSRFFPLPTRAIHWPLLIVAVAAALIAGALSVLLVTNPVVQPDVSVARSIQSTNWGPLAATFPFFAYVGGPGARYMQLAAVVVVLLLNRRAWLLLLASLAGGLSYFLLVDLVHRPRPTIDQVIRVTDHPGGNSFPSGHIIFITLTVGVLMLALGQRHLPKWARVIAWVISVAIVLVAGISRIYGGAHWPTDVIASVVIVAGWLALVTSVRWISDRALYKDVA
jgi:undecaprenyl-diphosphatase